MIFNQISDIIYPQAKGGFIRLFYYPAVRGTFFYPKDTIMIQLPKYLREMMQSNAYSNKNNPHYAQTNADVAKHLQRLYPGQMEMDATGRLRAPEYDMTREQFDAAQDEIESDFEEAKAQAEEELNEGLPPDEHIDIEQFVVPGDPIGVKVLYPNGDIRPESLETYDLDIPENIEPQKKPEYVFVWTTGGENPCDICEMMDGTILDDNHVPKPHPNCNCFATKMKKDDFDKKYGGADAGKQELYELLKAQEKMYELREQSDKEPKLDAENIIKLKEALAKLGYYKPDAKQGESLFNLYDMPNSRLTDAIKDFQIANNLEPTGVIENGDATAKALNSNYEYKGFSFSDPIKVDKNQVAIFDGEKLTIYQNNEKIDSWAGVSGRPGYQLPTDQVFKSTGPLPEGVYIAKQSNYQKIDLFSAVVGYMPPKGRGEWPGSTYSWGTSRVWLDPSQQTNTFGRDGFSVHGGEIPGSAGCIDLTSEMDGFSKWFENNGKDVIIFVSY